jgi:hypothetical protein
MKKLLVLMLVLGVASLANAGILLSVDGVNAAPAAISMAPGGTVTISLIIDDLGGTVSFLDVPTDGVSFTLGAAGLGPASGDLGSVMGPYDSFDAFGGGSVPCLEISANSSFSSTASTGVYATSLFTYGSGDVVMHLYVDPDYSNPVQTLTITPEPATLAILALGALLLRRKK